MAGNAVTRIEINDTDLRFRQKCNENFQQLARGLVLDGQTASVISDGIVGDFGDVIDDILAALNLKLEASNIIAGAGIEVTISGNNVTISTLCPIPVGGIYWHSDAVDPSTFPGFAGTFWTIEEDPDGKWSPLFAYRRLS